MDEFSSKEFKAQLKHLRAHSISFQEAKATGLVQKSSELPDWWWGEIVLSFTGGPDGSNWTAVVRDLGGSKMQVIGRSTSGSSGTPVAVLGLYTGLVRNLNQLQDQKGSWDFIGIHGLGAGSMYLEDERRTHWQPLLFAGFVPPAMFHGKLAFGKIHPWPRTSTAAVTT